jgi:hypothetical protein
MSGSSGTGKGPEVKEEQPGGSWSDKMGTAAPKLPKPTIFQGKSHEAEAWLNSIILFL